MSAPACPYPGLRPFDADEDALFFGRDRVVDALLARLAEARFLAVVGGSGSGKSSVVRAGLLPALERGLLRAAGPRWRFAVMRPGGDPLGRLAAALAPVDLPTVAGLPEAERPAVLEQLLRRSPSALADALEGAADGAAVLVVVDQLEELFRFAEAAGGEDDAAAFVKLLLHASAAPGARVWVVATMRSDFLGDCARFRDLPEAMSAHQVLVPRMARGERREAIAGPAGVAGVEVAPRLATRLLNEAGDDPGRLPVLQHALMRTWRAWEARAGAGGAARREPLDLADLEAAGGLDGALEAHAEEVYAELAAAGLGDAARAVLQAVTVMGAQGRGLRRPTALSALPGLTGLDADAARAVVEAFRAEGRGFLVPAAPEPLDADAVVDLSHESLMRGWGRLRAWVEEEARDAEVLRRLATTAALHAKGEAGLWRDPDLTLAMRWRERRQPTEAWAARYAEGFAGPMAFLGASEAARQAEVEEEAWRRERELEQARALAAAEAARADAERRSARRFRAATVVVAAAAVAAVAGFAWAMHERQAAVAARARAGVELVRSQVAAARAAAARGRDLEALARGVAAVADDRALREEAGEAPPDAGPWVTPDELGLGDALAELVTGARTWRLGEGHRLPVTAVASSPDGALVATASEDRTARVWTAAAEPVATLEGHLGTVTSVRFDAAGRRLATGGLDGTVRVWGGDGWAQASVDREPGGQGVVDVAFDPAGPGLVVAAAQAAWRLDPGGAGWTPLLALEVGERPTALDVRPDGSRVAVGLADGSVRVTGPAGGPPVVLAARWKPVRTMRTVRSVRAVRFLPVERAYLAVGDEAGVLRLWDVERPEEPLYEQILHLDGVTALAVTGDGRWLATGGGDGDVTLWRVGQAPPVRMAGHVGAVRGVAFGPSPARLFSAGFDRELHAWRMDGPWREELGFLPDAVRAVGAGPGGAVLAVDGRGNVRAWPGGEAALPPPEGGGWIDAAAAEPGAKALLVGVGGAVQRWTPDGGGVRAEALCEPGNAVAAVAASPDGARVAWATEDGRAGLCEGGAAREVAGPREGSVVPPTAVAASREGGVAVGYEDGAVRWVEGGADRWDLDAHRGEVTALVLDGHLVSGGVDGVVRDWPRPDLPGFAFAQDGVPVTALAFRPDPRRVAFGGADGRVRLAHLHAPDLSRRHVHDGAVTAVAFSEDGREVVSGGADERVVRQPASLADVARWRAWACEWLGPRAAAAGCPGGDAPAP